MKKIIPGACALLIGLVLNSAAQAAPISYRFDGDWHIESYGLAGEIGQFIGVDGPVVSAASRPFSLTFTYDSSVALTPRTMPPNSENVTYVDMFDVAGAFANVSAALGDYRFTVDALSSTSFSYRLPNLSPADALYARVGTFGAVSGQDGSDFAGTYAGKSFRLAYLSLSFESGPTGDALPLHLSGSPQTQLNFIADDGMVVTASYMGSLTEVPVPGAFWLFGSSILAPIALRIRNRS